MAEHQSDLSAKRDIWMSQRASCPRKRNHTLDQILSSNIKEKTPKPANANRTTKGIPSSVHQLLTLPQDVVAPGCSNHNSAI